MHKSKNKEKLFHQNLINKAKLTKNVENHNRRGKTYSIFQNKKSSCFSFFHFLFSLFRGKFSFFLFWFLNIIYINHKFVFRLKLLISWSFQYKSSEIIYKMKRPKTGSCTLKLSCWKIYKTFWIDTASSLNKQNHLIEICYS